MDPHVKNLREWIVLLFLLFCILDIAALQYGMTLENTGSAHPNPVVGQIVAIIRGSRGAWRSIYVTQAQITVFYGFLGSAAASLITMLAIVVGHGIHQSRMSKPAPLHNRERRSNRKRQDRS